MGKCNRCDQCSQYEYPGLRGLVEGRHRVDERTHCWNWTGPLAGSGKDGGYARVKICGLSTSVSRIVWYLQTGCWAPPYLVLMHSCDNPKCVNPDHLRLGTTSENVLEGYEKGRNTRIKRRGEAAPTAKLTDSEVLEILSPAMSGVPNWAMAERFGVHSSTICHIRRGRSWSHLNVNL